MYKRDMSNCESICRKIIEEIEDFVKKAYEKGGISSHDYLHILRVKRLAVEIGKRERADTFILEVAALLHDISLAFGGEKSVHAEESAKIAEKLLKDKIDDEKLEKIIDAIKNHSFSKGSTPKFLEGKILQDADRLDAIGAIGICRAIAYGTLKNRVLYNEMDPLAENREPNEDKYTIDHFFTKLLRIDMNTKTAEEEAKKRKEFMKRFLEELKREIFVKFED